MTPAIFDTAYVMNIADIRKPTIRIFFSTL